MADGDVLKIASGHQVFGPPTGGGGVTVDNQSDPPATVTSFIAPGATITDSEADLSLMVFGETVTHPVHIETDAAEQFSIGDPNDDSASVTVGPTTGLVARSPKPITLKNVDGDTVALVNDQGKLVLTPAYESTAVAAVDVTAATAVTTLLRLTSNATERLSVDKNGTVIVHTSQPFSVLSTDETATYFAAGPSGVFLGIGVTVVLANGFSLDIVDHNDAAIFSVRDDGSVHIKTGTSIQADL